MNQELQVIPLLAPADYQAGATDADSINMGKLHRVKIVVMFGAITGNDAVFKLYAGATAGAKTTELPFKYRVTGADSPAASADVFGARVAIAAGATGLTLASAAAWDLRTVQIDVESAELPEGKQWLTVETDDGSASVLLMAILAIGIPRVAADTVATAL